MLFRSLQCEGAGASPASQLFVQTIRNSKSDCYSLSEGSVSEVPITLFFPPVLKILWICSFLIFSGYLFKDLWCTTFRLPCGVPSQAAYSFQIQFFFCPVKISH